MSITKTDYDRNPGMARQWKLLRLVAGSPYMTRQVLAAKLGVALKTIRRDLLCLGASGFPLYFDERVDGKCFVRLERDWFLGYEPRGREGIDRLEVKGYRPQKAVRV